MLSKILAKGPFLPANISLITKPISQRQTNHEIEEIISQTWNELESKAKEQNQMLWNGESLRLDDLKEENGDLVLYTSPTDYKTRTCLERNITKIEDLDLAYSSAGLAIGGFIETLDGYFIFNQRSAKSVARNRIDFVGGVMDNVEAKDGFDLLNHNYLEILEEINLSEEFIENISILGLVLSDYGNVIIATHTKLKINFEQLNHIFEEGHDEEVQNLFKVNRDDLVEFITDLGGYKPKALELFESAK
jgi:hypothetical protein